MEKYILKKGEIWQPRESFDFVLTGEATIDDVQTHHQDILEHDKTQERCLSSKLSYQPKII